MCWKMRRRCHIMASALVISSICRQNAMNVMSPVKSHRITWVFGIDEISPRNKPSFHQYQNSWMHVVKTSFWVENFRRDSRKAFSKTLYARHTREIHILLLCSTHIEKLQTFQPTSRTLDTGIDQTGRICMNTVHIRAIWCTCISLPIYTQTGLFNVALFNNIQKLEVWVTTLASFVPWINRYSVKIN